MTASPARPVRRFPIACLAVIALFALTSVSASAATIKVKTINDEFATGTNCSLRQAIQSANTDTPFGGCTSGSGPDTIQLQGGKRYIRELPGPAAEDDNVSGDFDINSEIKITVKGKKPAELNGGGLDRVLQIAQGAKLTAAKLTIRDGVAYDNQPFMVPGGGGISNQGTLRLSRSTVTKNKVAIASGCDCGGGILSYAGTTVLDHVRVRGNTATNVGGGISWIGGTLRIDHSTIAGNTASNTGGGLSLGSNFGDANSMAIRNSTISGNHAHLTGGNFGGGAISVSDFSDAKMSIVNSTLYGNTSAANGGAIWVYMGDLDLKSSTVTQNTANADGGSTGGGGGIAGDIDAVDSIVAGNHDLNPATTSPDCYINVTISFSLVGKDGGCTDGSDNRSTASSKLQKLADNGGPTQTVALGAKSPAVGHAKKSLAPGRDQRGRKRDKHPDIGAFELIPKHHAHGHHGHH